ncbi:hypothetical protein EDM55_27400, partial [Brevibacillus centrosporus]
LGLTIRLMKRISTYKSTNRRFFNIEMCSLIGERGVKRKELSKMLISKKGTTSSFFEGAVPY